MKGNNLDLRIFFNRAIDEDFNFTKVVIGVSPDRIVLTVQNWGRDGMNFGYIDKSFSAGGISEPDMGGWYITELRRRIPVGISPKPILLEIR